MHQDWLLRDTTGSHRRGETHALNSVNLEVNTGSSIAIMQNASGAERRHYSTYLPSTLYPCGSHLLSMRRCTILKNERAGDTQGQVGFVFQSFNLIDEMTVRENVELAECTEAHRV